MSFFDALLGRIFSRGTELELGSGLDFKAPLSATPNAQTGLIDIAADWGDGVDVRSYGAVGTSNDSATLISALADVEMGGSVVIPAGVTVTIEGVTLDGRRIVGAGTLKWKAASTTTMITLEGSGAGLIGVTVDGNGANQTAGVGTVVGIRTLAAPNSVLYDVTFQNFRDKLIQTDIEDSPDGKVINCRFIECGTVVNANNLAVLSSRWEISDNTFSGTTTDGHYVRLGLFSEDGTKPVRDCIISGNTFSGTNTGSGIVLELNTEDAVIDGNTFRSVRNPIKMEAAGATVFGTVISGNTFRDCSGSNTPFTFAGNCTVVGNRCYDCDGGFSFEQGAICEGNYFDNCGDGTTAAIHVFSGSTAEYVIRGNTIKNAIDGAPGIECASADAIISGNWVELGGGGAMTDGILARGGRSSITDNTVINTGGRGIRIFLGGNTVCGNRVDGATDGINLASTCTESVVANNTIDNVSTTAVAFTNNAALRSVIIKNNQGQAVPTFNETIASGVIFVGLSHVQIALETEAAAGTDDLDKIDATDAFVGQIVILHDNSSSRDVTVKHNTNNIFLTGAADFVMTDSSHHIALMWSGTRWNELYRSTA